MPKKSPQPSGTAIRSTDALKFASMDDPAVAAIAEGRFRFATDIQALGMLQRVARQFVLAKDSPAITTDAPPAVKLWIKDYAITEEEKAKGHRGNYAEIRIKRIEGGRYSLVAKKLELDAKFHPERERPKSRHPNWGHPIMRAVKTGKIYPSLEVARRQLVLLHEEYPEVTIPGADKLHAMIYSNATSSDRPIQKVVIIIKPSGDGAQLALQQKAKNKPTPSLPKKEADAAQPQSGKFTVMVAQQRKRKKVAPKG